MNKALVKYLRRNEWGYTLEPETQRVFDQLVVIPVLDELEFIFKTLDSIAANPIDILGNTAVVIVVNNRETTEPGKIEANQKLLDVLRQGTLECAGRLHLMWVDASSAGCEIAGDGGVGTARKIGMDLMLPYLSDDAIILSLDADTVVSQNYLTSTREWFNANPSIPTAVLHFEHRFDTVETHAAIVDYELFMRQFTIGLRQVGSWYDYYSIGSAMAIRRDDYVKCGGMRIKNGGEDFYFMQAARKIGLVGRIDDAVVYPSARISDRVDFGTGPKMQQLVDGSDVQGYNPDIFLALDQVYGLVNELEIDQFDQLPALLADQCPKAVYSFFEQNGFLRAWPKVCRNTPAKRDKLREAFHIWFDALRILRFVHHIEENDPDKYGRVAMLEAFKNMSERYALDLPDDVLETDEALLLHLRTRRM